MARRIAYTGAPVITPQIVAEWRRNDAVLVESDLLTNIIIPGVVAQCESRTGAAIQAARYVETWPAHYGSGRALDVGQATEVESVDVLSADGAPVPSGAVHYLQQEQRESYLHFPAGRPAGVLRITYVAGVDLAAYPAVLNWLLLHSVLVRMNLFIVTAILKLLKTALKISMMLLTRLKKTWSLSNA